MKVPFALFAVSIFMILDLDGFNKVFDVVNVCYILLLFPVFILYKKRREEMDSEFEHRIYTYRKPYNKAKSWQDEFAGKWVKVERTNFYEVRDLFLLLLLTNLTIKLYFPCVEYCSLCSGMVCHHLLPP